MRRTLTAILLSILAIAALAGCASPAAKAPGEAKENSIIVPKADDGSK